MLADLISDGMSDYSTQDDRNMRIVAMNCLWHLFSDLLTSVKLFTPNPNELLLNPHLIILDHLKNLNKQQIISRLKEEFSRTTENPEVDRFVSLIFSKLPAWKLMVICLDLKRRATPGITAQRCIIKLLKTLSELSMHTRELEVDDHNCGLGRQNCWCCSSLNRVAEAT